MNKVYRVVFSQLTGHWVVTSELAKGKTKSNVMKKAATLAATAGLLASANTALAANCSTNLGSGGSLAEIGCTATGTNEDAKVTLTGHGSVDNTNIGSTIEVIAKGTGTATLEVNNTTGDVLTIKNDNGALTHGVIVQSQDPVSGGASGHATASFNGKNTIIVGDDGDTGVLVNSAGNSTISISGEFTLRNTAGGRPNELDGLEVLSQGDGNAQIIHNGTGKISTKNGHAVYAKNWGNSGNTIIDLKNTGIELETSGDNAYGVSAQTTGGAGKNVTLTSRATIKTIGNGSMGIFSDASNAGAYTSIYNYGTINTKGNTAHGIFALNKNYNTSIYNSGVLTVLGEGSFGIHANQTGTGNVLIENGADISATGFNGAGIIAEAANGSVTVTDTNNSEIRAGAQGIAAVSGVAATLSSVESNSRFTIDSGNATGVTGMVGLRAQLKTNNATGSAKVKYDGAGISVTSSTNNQATSYMVGIQATDSGSVITSKVNASVEAKGNIDVKLNNGAARWIYGIEAISYSAGDASIHYKQGTINVQANNSTVSAGYGLVAWNNVGQGGGTGSATITTDVGTTVNTVGDKIIGIHARSSGLNSENKKVIVDVNSTITTNGVDAYGLHVRAEEDAPIYITNRGNILTEKSNSIGIISSSVAGNVTLINRGNIITKDAAGIVVRADKGNVDILASGNITTGQISDSVGNHGINAYSGEGKVNVNYNDGVIKVVGKDNTATGGGRNIGIAVWDKDLATLGTEGLINLGSTATVDASEGTAGLLIRNNGKGEINIAQGAQVHGGSLTGVLFTSNGSAASHTLNNDGIVDSMNDQAVLMTSAQAGNKLTINNYGTLTGFVTSGAEDTTFSNHSSNSFNIRNFADTDGDLIRDTKAVAISNFGGGNDVFKNELTGTVRLAAVTGESTVDTTNEYITSGALSINKAGIVQGQLINLNTFENRGTIDLTENKQAGDILVIGGGATAGTYGSGLFISDGGTLELDTVLNEGDINSLSDLLVIDDSTVGTGGATRLKINVVNDTSHLETMGQLTQGEGIKVIESLGTSSANSFKLDKPMAYGLYEYVLGQGSADQNWYLRNMYDKNIPIFNPATGAYLANQTAASSLFMHTLYDRQGHANNIAGGSEKKSSVWVRAATSNAKNQSVNNTMNVDTDSNLIHLGGDIGKWQIQEGNLHLGLMGAYGQTESDVVSKLTNTLAKGKVTGYSVGLYGTWFADEAQGKGLYVDSWAQYGWYKNKISGEAQVNKEDKYDSNSWAVSLEAGYGIHLATRGNTEIMLTPQAQIAYTNYSADDYKDGNNLKITGDKASGIHTRLGARLYGRALEGYSAKPYLEINWLHDTAKNSAQFEGGRGGSMELKDGVPKDKAEGKMGLQGTIAKNWKVWGQVGAQWGGKGYTRYEGQAGLNYQW
ncbi:autotransporter outer membrane beta-barrel domain-containing protein [Neisseria sp. Ec49-e6-T10]|uniref:autotransporter outer membrane beta-barrel domain-containing protein n=1 Tax=Neisseria sp. Ec49-e6-T10 TaxID=3140744 RepID=UPI003EBC775E